VRHVHLATGLAIRDGPGGERSVLLVASRYPNQPLPLWNLPGGRQQPGELLSETVEREVFEETQLRLQAGALAYLSESYDGPGVHFVNTTFHLEVYDGASSTQAHAASTEDHVAEVAWVAFSEIAARITVAVVREPLIAYLRGELVRRYAGVHDAGITIEWPSDSR
jgi:ADP-ribose pyrophosphatase YjhB (NUDIX family)